ncbi:Major facilitator super domain-containing protein 12 [Saguinus oedipus]|uniref:Major facilitator super domain-containing protein 12 n=1 Tax=Saguinus oedipus TaxID=9490 RepID=A0ABQ9UZR4_SAGOE|nr:Major facilitator super domain-containing protein 12 [Saguinus oedipus]
MVANITVYGAARLLLHLQGSSRVGPTQDISVSDQLGGQDMPLFRNLSLLVVGVGDVFLLQFHPSTQERRWLRAEEPGQHSPLLSPAVAQPLLLWKHWASGSQFSTSGFSFLMKPINKCIGRNTTYFSGLLVILAFAAWVAISEELGVPVYAAAVLQDSGCAPPSLSPRWP